MAVLSVSVPEQPLPRCNDKSRVLEPEMKILEADDADESSDHIVDGNTDGNSKVLYDESKPKNLSSLIVRKVRFQLPESFREEICDSDHPAHKSIRQTAAKQYRDKKIAALEDMYQGRRKRLSEALGGISLATLSAEMLHLYLLEYVAEVATSNLQSAQDSLRAAKMHFHHVKAAALAHQVGGPSWMVFVKTGLEFGPVTPSHLKNSVQGSAHNSLNPTSGTSAKVVHAFRSQVHHDVKVVHAAELAAAKAKAAVATAATTLHLSACPLGLMLASGCLLYARMKSQRKSS